MRCNQTCILLTNTTWNPSGRADDEKLADSFLWDEELR